MLVLVYFFAMGLIANFFVLNAVTGLFLQKLWLLTFMLATVAGFANYILIIIVAKEMYIHYKH